MFFFSPRLSLAAGNYDVEIPCDTLAGEYSIRVGRFENPSLYSCSAPFMVIAGEDSSEDSDSSESSDSSDDGSMDSDSSDDGSMSYRF